MLELRAVDAQVDRLRLRALQLRLRLHDVDPRRDAGVVAVLRDVVRGRECPDGVLEEVALRVGHAQLEVVGRELRLQRKAGALEVGDARLLARARGLDEPADAPPHVDLPLRVDAHRVAIAGVAGGAAARGAGVEAEGRQETGARRTHRGPRLRVARLGGLEVLVGDAHLLHEPIEHRVVEYLPPLSLRHRVARSRDDPVAGFLERGRHFRLGTRVIRPDGAPGHQRQCNHR